MTLSIYSLPTTLYHSLLFHARKNNATKLTKRSDKLAIENMLLFEPSDAIFLPSSENPVRDRPENANIDTTVTAAIAIREI
jgi:hypothetical protein